MNNKVGGKPYRSQKGSLAAVFLAASTIIGFSLGVLAIDTAHLAVVKSELQNACDAAAIAGAQDLATDPSKCEGHAFAVAAENTADGRAVSNSSPYTSVLVAVTPPGALGSGQVAVDAQMRLNHTLARMFGRTSDVITAHAVAGGGSVLRRLYAGEGFPLAVPWGAPGPNGIPLSSLKIGDSFDLVLNSQNVKNAAWTSFTVSPTSSNYINNAVDMSLGLEEEQPGYIPSVKVGDSIETMNGVTQQINLSREGPAQTALLNAPLLILPVIDQLPSGNDGSIVIGFIGIDVTAVTRTTQQGQGQGGQVLIISVTLKDGTAWGDDCPTCTPTFTDQALDDLSVSPVKLIE